MCCITEASVKHMKQSHMFIFLIIHCRSYYERDSTEVRVGLGRADVGEITRVKVKGKRLMDFWYLKSVVVKPFWTDKE